MRNVRQKNQDGIGSDLELATGAVAGAAAGGIAGPVGAIVGAGMGTAAAVLAQEALAREHEIKRQQDERLDEAIGVSGGEMGGDPDLGFVKPPGVAPYLRGDHDELNALAEGVLGIIEDGDNEEVRAILSQIEARLTEHMDAEERELLPAYAEESPEDAATIFAQHEGFKRIFLELAIAGDLHTVRLERVKELVDALRAHAKHENEGLYRWAAERTNRF
jgi:hypothetical protein